MSDLVVLLMGVAIGSYFADEVRSVAPILDKSKGG